MADLEALVEKILKMRPEDQFLMVAQLFIANRADIAWAIAHRICDEHEAAKIVARLRA